ncbi:hypothetical protein MCOR27_007597 [Pyricularia oryzae]|uniref:Uncharacterized protein n=5 Tax=Pyricularia TaxID=48558 RepID=A0ABQ8NDL5_PYRGI|nr:uncharacterized protein MGG_07100 [Pyricularia oryzae 70-15]ELQ35425.1 hypothetical protein OOU_Y34scaffold00707g9 [Pyricularia oryzae Y34]KAH8839683.1 hypothetical protein MCOR01_008870 [Pyricularia oryzae]KAI6295353.1 hypothetical protein MCOR33_007746 [Pyricularia grisea]EHA55486.1 hypothetical protein MGG_07100 [Pyricularia oryzae 70-15]KAH9439543.1 hypothetical protein MCOR02_003092 [Pyricularia oryzae]
MHAYVSYMLPLVGSVIAQSTTTMVVSMPQLNMNRTWSGSIVKADKTLTEIDIKCGAPVATTTISAPPCQFTNGIRVTQGPSVWGYSLESTESNVARTYHATCSFSESKTMTCSGSVVAKVTEGSSTATHTSTDVQTVTNAVMFPVTASITAGADKVASATAGPTKTSTGGLPKMTQKAVLAGVVAVVGGVVMI